LKVDSTLTPDVSSGETPEQRRLVQEGLLTTCDGVVLVYGQAPVLWIQSQFAFTRKTLAQRRRGVWGALVDGPPPDKPDAGLRSSSLLTLNCRSGFDPTLLGDFIGKLRAESTSGWAG
jgi:hypothetical protein